MTQITREFEETAQQFCSLLVFQLAGQVFALSIESVSQIIPMLRLTPVPQVNDMIEGVANIHGKIVPVISARRHLGFPYLEPGLYTPIILTRISERQVGWIVDEVIDVISVPSESVTAPGEILPEGLEQTQVISGLVYQQDHSILVLDPRCFLRPSQFRTINRAVHTNTRPIEPLDGDDSDDFRPASPSKPAVFETMRADLAQKANEAQPGNGSGNGLGNGSDNGSGNGHKAAPAQVEPPVTQPAPQAAAPQAITPETPAELPNQPAPVVVENSSTTPEAPADAAASTEAAAPTEPPAETPAKPAKSSKRGSRKGKIIPNTATRPAGQRQIGRRKMNAVLADQFEALAQELRETELQSCSEQSDVMGSAGA